MTTTDSGLSYEVLSSIATSPPSPLKIHVQIDEALADWMWVPLSCVPAIPTLATLS